MWLLIERRGILLLQQQSSFTPSRVMIGDANQCFILHALCATTLVTVRAVRPCDIFEINYFQIFKKNYTFDSLMLAIYHCMQSFGKCSAIIVHSGPSVAETVITVSTIVCDERKLLHRSVSLTK